MVNGFDSSLDDRLKKAEEAEIELQRLQPMAAEAPKLRETRARLQKRQAQQRSKESFMQAVHRSVEAASARQTQVPQLLENAGRAVKDLYEALKEIDRHRKGALDCLTKVDRIDYEIEVEESEEEELAKDRDPRGVAYALASQHGEPRVRSILQEMDPEFAYLNGCDLTNSMVRDTVKFVMSHALSAPNHEIPAMEQALAETMEEVAEQ
jgi:hypothetical protein